MRYRNSTRGLDRPPLSKEPHVLFPFDTDRSTFHDRPSPWHKCKNFRPGSFRQTLTSRTWFS